MSIMVLCNSGSSGKKEQSYEHFRNNRSSKYFLPPDNSNTLHLKILFLPTLYTVVEKCAISDEAVTNKVMLTNNSYEYQN